MPTSPVAHNSLGAVIGIAVLGALVVALVALFIGYRHWQKGKEHEHLAVAYSSGRLDGSDYVMPGERGGGGGGAEVSDGQWGVADAPPPPRDVGWKWEESGRPGGYGPGFRLSLSYLVPVFVLQMSLRATATTTPTLATTLCLSAPPIPHPLTRSVHRGGCALHVGGGDSLLRKALTLRLGPHRPPSGSRRSALCRLPGTRAARQSPWA